MNQSRAFGAGDGRMLGMEMFKQYQTPILLSLLGILLGGVFYLYRALMLAEGNLTSYTAELSDVRATIDAREARILELSKLLDETKSLLEEAVDERDELDEDLNREKDRNEEFEEQIQKIGSTVGVLDKLAKTDPELLQKYSKVYFLNEHYMPEKLVELPENLVYQNGGDPEFMHASVFPFYKDMTVNALEDGVTFSVVSAFRSFDEQRALKGAYSVTYGSGANTFSADQGYSEHQLGTTVDLTTENLGGGLASFETTPAYTWLVKNAYKHGFVLSYPKDNAYYIFEPWHWRFVGTDLARKLHRDDTFFYDVDQREIDEYLISLFD